MIVINLETYKVTQCSRRHAAKMVGVVANTLWRWECEKLYPFRKVEHSNHMVVFDSVEYVKQLKGFALNKNPKP